MGNKYLFSLTDMTLGMRREEENKSSKGAKFQGPEIQDGVRRHIAKDGNSDQPQRHRLYAQGKGSE